MNKKLRTEQIKRHIKAIALSGVIVSSINMTDIFADANLNNNLPGIISVKANLGDEFSPGYIQNTDMSSEAGGSYKTHDYGLNLLNGVHTNANSKTPVEEFVEWLKNNYPEFKSIFSDNLKSDTEEFDTAWEKASKLNQYDFALAQQLYRDEMMVAPVAKHINDNYNIDLKANRGLEELLFSVLNQFGQEKGLSIITKTIEKNSLNNQSSSEDIIKAIQENRIKAISDMYTSDVIKKVMTNNASNETAEYLNLANEEALTLKNDSTTTSNITETVENNTISSKSTTVVPVSNNSLENVTKTENSKVQQIVNFFKKLFNI